MSAAVLLCFPLEAGCCWRRRKLCCAARAWRRCTPPSSHPQQPCKPPPAPSSCRYPAPAINILKAHGKSAKESQLLDGYALNMGRAAQVPRGQGFGVAVG